MTNHDKESSFYVPWPFQFCDLSFYPRIAHLRIPVTLGGLPCISRPTRKIRPPIQMASRVNTITPHSPTTGCHSATPPGILCRINISVGVKGGTSDSQVAIVEFGSCKTGPSRNRGIRAGKIAGRFRFWASAASLQADPRAVVRYYRSQCRISQFLWRRHCTSVPTTTSICHRYRGKHKNFPLPGMQ